MPRPDMTAWFRAAIDRHVHGMMSTVRQPMRPPMVMTITGTVTSSVITVTMVDGTVWQWSGGRYATRKVNGCYAPLMPRKVTDARA